MCYSIYLSTDSDQDLSTENTEFVRFEKTSEDEPITSLLKYPHKWYVGSQSGCSCTFRHLLSVDLGFGEPVEWYEEGDDEIAATLAFVRIIRRLLDDGNQLDCIDIWQGATKEDITEKAVDMGNMADEEFRFFENHHFQFVRTP